MSVVSNIHTAVIYDAKKSVAQDGQRLVVTIAKADKSGNYGPHLQQTMCTSVPRIDLDEVEEHSELLIPWFVGYLEEQQNKMIAERIKAGRKEVTTDELSVLAIVTWLNTEKTGDRWDKERVADWFDSCLAENIGVKLLTDGKDESFVEKSLNAYKKLMSDTLGSKSAIPRKVAETLLKPLALADENDAVAKRFVARLNKVLEEVNIDAELFGL